MSDNNQEIQTPEIEDSQKPTPVPDEQIKRVLLPDSNNEVEKFPEEAPLIEVSEEDTPSDFRQASFIQEKYPHVTHLALFHIQSLNIQRFRRKDTSFYKDVPFKELLLKVRFTGQAKDIFIESLPPFGFLAIYGMDSQGELVDMPEILPELFSLKDQPVVKLLGCYSPNRIINIPTEPFVVEG